MSEQLNKLKGVSIGQEIHISKEQSQQEVIYKMSVRLLNILQNRGLVNDEQHAQILQLNKESFSPQLEKVYI